MHRALVWGLLIEVVQTVQKMVLRNHNLYQILMNPICLTTSSRDNKLEKELLA
jgi:hypothetical protein